MEETVQGIVVARRIVSKHLAFATIEVIHGNEFEIEKCLKKVVFREEYFNQRIGGAGFPRRKVNLHLGDTVKVHCRRISWKGTDLSQEAQIDNVALSWEIISHCSIRGFQPLQPSKDNLKRSIISSHQNENNTDKCKDTMSSCKSCAYHKCGDLSVRINNSYAPGSRVSPKVSRFNIFSQWIVSTFPVNEFVDSKSNRFIADVAGGRGFLSYQLFYNYGLNVILIDPSQKANNLTSRMKRAIKKATERNNNRNDKGNKLGNFKFSNKAFHENLCDGGNLDEPLREILLSSPLVVGLHPDEATEPIINFCLRHRKAFAVIPCCVFPELFPFRLHPQTNLPVKTTDEFIDYLCHKNSNIRVTTLPFEGRNTVVYKL